MEKNLVAAEECTFCSRACMCVKPRAVGQPEFCSAPPLLSNVCPHPPPTGRSTLERARRKTPSSRGGAQSHNKARNNKQESRTLPSPRRRLQVERQRIWHTRLACLEPSRSGHELPTLLAGVILRGDPVVVVSRLLVRTAVSTGILLSPTTSSAVLVSTRQQC